MPNVGTVPVDYSTNVGLTRALLGDDDSVPLDPPVSGQGEFAWFADDAITGVLGLYGNNPKRAAARLLMTVAASQALLLKKWSTDDLRVDGSVIAETLRRQAAQLQQEADDEEANADIFEIGKIGPGYKLWPEGAALPWGARVGLAVEVPSHTSGSSDDGPNWVVNDDGYLISE